MEIAIILLALLITAIALLIGRVNETQHPFPFDKRPALYTKAERTFLQLIEKAVGQEYKVLCRVRLADILTIRENLPPRSRQNALNRANGKFLDFVLCDPQSLEVVAAIDLVNLADKKGHNKKKDWFLSGALDASRVPYIRIQIRRGYSVKEVRECIYGKLRRSGYKPPVMPGVKIPAPLARPAKPLTANGGTDSDLPALPATDTPRLANAS